MELVKLPTLNVQEIPEALRTLAGEIESGNFGDAHNLAWVIDCGDGVIEAGLLGGSPQPAPLAHYLFALAQRHIENI